MDNLIESYETELAKLRAEVKELKRQCAIWESWRNHVREQKDAALLRLSEWSKTLNWIRNTHRCNGVAGKEARDCSICNAIDGALLGKPEKRIERCQKCWSVDRDASGLDRAWLMSCGGPSGCYCGCHAEARTT